MIKLALPFKFSKEEIKDIVISTLALGFIFTWNAKLFFGNPAAFFLTALITTAIVALSFIPHELMHKYSANKFHCHARYEMWKTGLLIALALAIISNGSFVFAAPGAVVIYTSYYSHRGLEQVGLSSRQNAVISAAGPLTNIAIAAAFFALLYLSPTSGYISIYLTIIKINAFLAMFNLIPLPPLDGSKVIWYSIVWWALLMAGSVALYMFI